MHPVNTDRERFRVRCDDLLVPGAADAVLALVDDPALFAFAMGRAWTMGGQRRPDGAVVGAGGAGLVRSFRCVRLSLSDRV